MSYILRFRGSAIGVGSGAPTEIQCTEFLDPNTGTWEARNAPIIGSLKRVQVTNDNAGPATQVNEINLREGSGGDIRVQFQAVTLDMDEAVTPGSQSYQTSDPTDVLFDITVDDGANSTNITIIADIEVE